MKSAVAILSIFSGYGAQLALAATANANSGDGVGTSAKASHRKEVVEVIGVGFPRTGSDSLRTALNMLGYNTYHMKTCMPYPEDVKFWTSVFGPGSDEHEPNYDEFFSSRNVTAVVDVPAMADWRRLIEVYPSAKVILTVRSAESWWNSSSITIFQFFSPLPFRILRRIHPEIKAMFEMVTYCFAHMLPFLKEQELLYPDPSIDKEASMKAFDAHIEEVKRTVPADRLFVWKIGDGGWEPLVNFLGKSVLATGGDVKIVPPFPRINGYVEFKLFQYSRLLPLVYVLVPLLGLGFLLVKALARSSSRSSAGEQNEKKKAS